MSTSNTEREIREQTQTELESIWESVYSLQIESSLTPQELKKFEIFQQFVEKVQARLAKCGIMGL
jgi:hypothetical protein